ncbi:MAG: DMT family transporter [Anaerolineae bacterium]
MGQLAEENERREYRRGIYSGLLGSFLLGWAPILGKLAYRAEVTSLTLAALRTLVAVGLLFLVYLVRWRSLLRLGWRDLLNCLLVGMINGIGSLFYYSGLVRIDASPASLLSTLYAVWVVIFLAAAGQAIGGLTLMRLGISLLGAVLVTSPWSTTNPSDYLGSMLLVASAAINGWYMVMGQWVLADVPARSATLYILTGMAITVSMAWVAGGDVRVTGIAVSGWGAIVALGITTALSRLAMFFSMERLGGVQTVILNLLEMVVSLTLAMILLGESLTWVQWIGALLLVGGGYLARRDVAQGGAPPPSFNPMDV